MPYRLFLTALSAGLLSALPYGAIAQTASPDAPSAGEPTQSQSTGEPANIGLDNASEQANSGVEITFDQLLDLLSSAAVPDAAAPPMVGADIQSIVEADRNVRVVPITELEGWTGDRGKLSEVIKERGQSLTELREAIEARPDLVQVLEAEGAAPEDVLMVTTSGTGIYSFFVAVGADDAAAGSTDDGAESQGAADTQNGESLNDGAAAQ